MFNMSKTQSQNRIFINSQPVTVLYTAVISFHFACRINPTKPNKTRQIKRIYWKQNKAKQKTSSSRRSWSWSRSIKPINPLCLLIDEWNRVIRSYAVGFPAERATKSCWLSLLSLSLSIFLSFIAAQTAFLFFFTFLFFFFKYLFWFLIILLLLLFLPCRAGCFWTDREQVKSK